MDKSRTDRDLRVLNARSFMRKLSKRHTMFAVAAMACALLMASPSVAHAAEVDAPEAQKQAAVQVVENVTAQAQEQQEVSAPKHMAEVTKSSQAGQAEEKADQTETKSDTVVDTKAEEKADHTETKSDTVADTKADQAAPAVKNEATQAKAGEKPVVVETTGKNADVAGTDIIFDFNQDGKTDTQDWIEYANWIKTFKPFDFDLQTGDLGDSYNGGLQVTGATDYLINGYAKAIKTLDPNLHLSKVRQYYLNNIGQATPVKNQSPWGSCWSFGSTAALESAILKAMAENKQGLDGDFSTPKLTGISDHGVNLAELQLAWYIYELQLGDLSWLTGTQKGEGIKDVLPPDNDHADQLNAGGWGSMSETLYGAWQGIANTAQIPYWPSSINKDEYDAMIAQLEKWSHSSNVSLANTAKDFLDDAPNWENGVPPQSASNFWLIRKFASNFNWAPKLTLESGKLDQIARVDGVYYLPAANYLVPDKDNHLVWKGQNVDYINTLKQALVEHGAVQIGYNADSSRPGESGNSDYFNYQNWAQYCDAINTEVTHAVTIVGWNDDFDASNFKAGANDISGLKNGAWLVKNSWGTDWGIRDEHGHGTGYFWLSYYDRSINAPSYFSVELPGKDGKFKYDNNYSYDFNVNESNEGMVFKTADKGTEVANVFTAKNKETLRAVSVHTSDSNSHATVKIYIVGEGEDVSDFAKFANRKADLEFEQDFLLPGLHQVELSKTFNLVKGQKFVIIENIVSADANDPSKQNSYINLETNMAKASLVYRDEQGNILYFKVDKDGNFVKDKNGEFVQDPNGKPMYLGQSMGFLMPHTVCHDGETYIKIMTKDGYKWMTPEQLTNNYSEGDIFWFGNALIKAYTTNAPENTEVPGGDGDVAPSIPTVNPEGQVKTTAAPKHMAATPQTGDTTNLAAAALAGVAGAVMAAGAVSMKRKMD